MITFDEFKLALEVEFPDHKITEGDAEGSGKALIIGGRVKMFYRPVTEKMENINELQPTLDLIKRAFKNVSRSKCS